MAVVPRSMLSSGSTVSKSNSFSCGETKTLATKSPDPPAIGWAWQPAQESESGPEVRKNIGTSPVGRLVGMVAAVAAGRPWPSSVVKRAVNRSLPKSRICSSGTLPASISASLR